MLLEALLFIILIVAATIVYIDRRFTITHPTIQSSRPKLVYIAQAILPAVILLFLIRSFIFEGFRIPSASMKPTLLEGDFIIVDKYSTGLRLPLLGYRLTANKVNRGDVIVFRSTIAGENTPFIKRVIGLPGDHIRYKNRTLFLNNKPVIYNNLQTEIEIQPNGTTTQVIRATEQLPNAAHQIYLAWHAPDMNFNNSDIVVPANSYFVLGDYRDNSQDSRDWGVVSDRAVIGKARYIVLSFDYIQHNLRWTRVGSIQYQR